jgi:phospholipid/cholesterol/gamma-HCH transport system ATP-binding protein
MAANMEAKIDNPDSSEAVAVAVEGLRKSFGEQMVLNGIDLTAEAGQALAVLGRSGSGKSVLLKLIVGLQAPDQGRIRIHGQEVTNLQPEQLNEVRKKVGFLFQQGALYDSLNVRDNVDFPLRRNSKLSTVERRERVSELLAKVGMERDGDKMPSEISGGMQKRVGLARALALEPDILLFDEPTAGLDPITAAEIGNLISKLRAERTITSIVVTHDLHGAKSFCDRLVLMKDGCVSVDGTFNDLEKSREPFAIQFLKDAPR